VEQPQQCHIWGWCETSIAGHVIETNVPGDSARHDIFDSPFLDSARPTVRAHFAMTTCHERVAMNDTCNGEMTTALKMPVVVGSARAGWAKERRLRARQGMFPDILCGKFVICDEAGFVALLSPHRGNPGASQ
jgi:hypothetical protein